MTELTVFAYRPANGDFIRKELHLNFISEKFL